MNIQKHLPEAFCKKMFSWKFHKIHRKTPVPETFLIKLQASGLQLYQKRGSGTGDFL